MNLPIRVGGYAPQDNARSRAADHSTVEEETNEKNLYGKTRDTCARYPATTQNLYRVLGALGTRFGVDLRQLAVGSIW